MERATSREKARRRGRLNEKRRLDGRGGLDVRGRQGGTGWLDGKELPERAARTDWAT